MRFLRFDGMMDARSTMPADCRNCGTALHGEWCHACGQRARPHRTLGALGHEIVEGVTHADGRMWHTMWLLFANPGRLTLDWIEGRQVRYVPPLHLFLCAMFLLFLLMGISDVHLTPLIPQGAQMGSEWQPIADKWMLNPALSRYKIDAWAYKLSFLTVPLGMLATGLLLAGKRRYTLYDHGVFALNAMAFISFCAVALAVVGQLSVTTIGTVLPALLLVHSVFHLRGAYQLGWIGAIWRAMALTLFGALIFTTFFYVACYAAMLL